MIKNILFSKWSIMFLWIVVGSLFLFIVALGFNLTFSLLIDPTLRTVVGQPLNEYTLYHCYILFVIGMFGATIYISILDTLHKYEKGSIKHWKKIILSFIGILVGFIIVFISV